MQNIYKRMIKIADFADEVITSRNGREAMDFYYEQIISGADKPALPELIFLDLNMPVMDGWTFLEEFVKIDIPSHLRPDIVVITSSRCPADEERAGHCPTVQRFMSKPLTIEKLEGLKKQLAGNLQIA